MATEHRVEIERHARRRRSFLAGLAWALLVPILLMAITYMVRTPGVGAPSWLGYALLALETTGLLPAAWIYRRARRSAVARCDERGVTLVVDGAEQRIPIETIVSALAVADERAPRIELRLVADDALTLRFGTIDEARRALDALCLARRGRTERIPLYPESGRLENQAGGAVLGVAIMAVPVMVMALALGSLGVLIGAPLLLVAGWFAGSFFASLLSTITIGADGIAFGTVAFPTTKFVAYRDIARFELSRVERRRTFAVLSLVRANGEKEELGSFEARDLPRAEAILRRLTEAMERAKEREVPVGSAIAELDARGEAPPAWLARLQKLAGRDDGYRTEAIDDARVDAILADGAASPEQRVGAAMLLRIRDQARGRDRIRIASEACADPAARDALLAVAEANAEEEALDAAARRIR